MRRPQISQELSRVLEHVERWRRRHGGRGSRIPGRLWDEAAGIARREGAWATARTLHLNYGRLKDRMASAPVGKERGQRPSGFVEVSGAQILSVPAGPVLEMTGRDGMRLTVRLAGGEKLDAVGLLGAFRRRRG